MAKWKLDCEDRKDESFVTRAAGEFTKDSPRSFLAQHRLALQRERDNAIDPGPRRHVNDNGNGTHVLTNDGPRVQTFTTTYTGNDWAAEFAFAELERVRHIFARKVRRPSPRRGRCATVATDVSANVEIVPTVLAADEVEIVLHSIETEPQRARAQRDHRVKVWLPIGGVTLLATAATLGLLLWRRGAHV